MENLQNWFLFLVEQTDHLMGLRCAGQVEEIPPEVTAQISSVSVLDWCLLAKLLFYPFFCFPLFCSCL